MHVLLTGGTGYIGAAVLDRLVSTGHRVTALVRDPGKAEQVRARGAEPAVADLSDSEAVHDLAAASDGVIHLASPGDGTSAAVDEIAVTAILRALRHTDRPFVHTTGVWVHGSGTAINETSPMNPPRLAAWRIPLAERVREAEGVRTSVIAPAVVYGRGGGLVNLVAAGARTEGSDPALTMIGPGDQHWSTIHVDDLAALYTLALEKAPAGSYFLGASGVNPTVREITEAVSRSLGLSGHVEPEPVVQTLTRLDLLGEALLLDQQATGDTARRVLGWSPEHPSILDEIAGTRFSTAL
ncbi:NAD-dependent epimerase/dehydratase family protein [Streptomyces sp. NPDC003077]|uniref:NAD-dependent epimerase/dehydratase family protein n=1 Tax=Streptomyces sp. NPDC003077 TaxID=3154443 RepID=UPI0033A340F5